MTIEAQLQTAELRLIPRLARVAIRAGDEGDGRYGARFRGHEPAIREHGDVVTVEYPRLRASVRRATGELRLDPSRAWAIRIDGGASRLVADLGRLPLRSFEITGGASHVDVVLPEPAGRVLVRVTGGASDVSVRRPAGTAASLRIAGGATKLSFDDERDAADRYEIEVAGGASSLSVTAT